MTQETFISRRVAVKSSVFGVLVAAIPNVIYANSVSVVSEVGKLPLKIHDRYPAIDETVVAEVVGVSHFNLDRLKELVDPRPELARATWDWGFGDWETAIGAASHVARRDIAEYLILKGARPDIFTFAMLGAYTTVKSMIEFHPGVQHILGPHGISLLQHAKNGLSANEGNTADARKLVDYLSALGDADSPKYPDVAETDKQKYLGDYKYGDGPLDGFSIKLNMRKLLTLGKVGKNGGALYKTGENKFIYNGTPSVQVSFLVESGKVISLTVTEPGLTLTAKKL
ncbi:MAG: hypothetical protein V4592_23035 [Bacteroidota bacterium]